MSIFNELLPKINEISHAYVKNFNDDLKAALESLDKFEEEFISSRARAREKTAKGKDKNLTTTLQSIDEDEVEPTKAQEPTTEDSKPKRKSSTKASPDITSDLTTVSISSTDSDGTQRSKKRSKNEVDGLLSPEQDKRQKRNASVKAQSIISKQVNVNLTQKLRRENSTEKSRRRHNDDDKENEPVPVVQIKLEKISLPPETMDMGSLPVNIAVKTEPHKDDIAMPPPAMPVPKPRKNVPKERTEESTDEESSAPGKRRTRTRKQTDTAPPVVASARSTRSTRHTDVEEAPPADVRPKRTRAKKKISEPANNEDEKEIPPPQENGIASPAEKPRPKRTRRGQKAAEKPQEPELPTPEPIVQEPMISPKEERISQPEMSSPIIPQKEIKKPTKKNKKKEVEQADEIAVPDVADPVGLTEPDAAQVPDVGTNLGLANSMDQTMVLPNGVYNHAPVTPKNIRNMNETVVLEKTMILEKKNKILDATVVIEKMPTQINVTEDDSLMTDDSDLNEPHTPPLKDMPKHQPSSAVKEKVQQFEELASRVTRTKTRAMAKKEDDPVENATPPDKVSKAILSVDTLNKMNNMIFNGKTQISSSASKPRTNVVPVKSFVPSSTSKISAINKAKEAAEESLKREKEDARKKKEAMLEAKRELQKRKREEKMAAAAAAREAAERERRAALQAAARERLEKQAHADLGKIERMKEAERKKQELARKVAETEERRRAEEQARQQRLADEQRRADAARRKQLEEADNMKREEAKIAKDIEKRQKEYNEKQKMKYRLDDKTHTPLKMPGTPCSTMEPVYMTDGFQYLNSDEEAEPVERPTPEWSTSRARRQQLVVQSCIASLHVDRLFGVRVHSPDLRDIFPAIERARLKRTSSAVWRTPPPPPRLPALAE